MANSNFKPLTIILGGKNMSKFYEKLDKLRDETYNAGMNYFQEQKVLNILVQLLSAAFKNSLQPGELPKIFLLQNVELDEEQLTSLLNRLDLTVTYNLIEPSFTKGYMYIITQNL